MAATTTMANPAPRVFDVSGAAQRTFSAADLADEGRRDAVDAMEVFEMLRRVRDPEHPTVTLEQLKIVAPELIACTDDDGGGSGGAATVDVQFTPTVAHCTMATLIGLSIRVKLLRSLPRRFKVRVTITPGSHSTEEDVNKQLNDKERIAAAMENPALLSVINGALADS